MARGKKPRNDSASSSLEGAPVRGKRVQVSKRVRFEVFKRDKFTCQYCGRKAPDVVLHIEHIEAVSRGGTNDVINLIAACSECNAGKSNIPLSDDTAVAKQHAQLAELEERREQQQMMLKWRRGLQRINEETADQVHEQWRTLVPGYSLNESGERTLKKILRKYSVAEVIEAIETATDKHLVFEDGKPTHDSVNLAFNSIEGIARFQRFAKDNPPAPSCATSERSCAIVLTTARRRKRLSFWRTRTLRAYRSKT